MPNTIPAAGEAMPEVTLEQMIARHNAALAAANSCDGPLEDTPEEAELHAAVEAFVESTAKLTSYAGVLDAMRLAAKENEDFSGSEITVTLVKGVLDFLEAREKELPVDRVERLAIELSEALPQWANGQFMAMVYPAGDVRGYWFRSIRFDRSHEPDPVVAALQAYNDGNKAFEAIGSANFDQHGGEEAVIAKTYGPPMEVIDTWDKPCTTREGAIAALRHALDECDAFSCSDSLTAMTRAALLYLEGAPE
ncbi:hypothetical protein EGT36_21325 [Agrobacterium sp. FDAARGOS_525]|uniref:hypothetical protein n=1 Tax=Agrobacterium sp. FDAARGOS_525 TaxID=2420311 RepID=UPI000F675D4C|nr:hypothetical protein [Agrobacterium sp. FDAARGOS_525]RSC31219.1 hypothetical protein EGT36_21325 [Agrobacterium sp. FDAARGOS_525]